MHTRWKYEKHQIWICCYRLECCLHMVPYCTLPYTILYREPILIKYNINLNEMVYWILDHYRTHKVFGNVST